MRRFALVLLVVVLGVAGAVYAFDMNSGVGNMQQTIEAYQYVNITAADNTIVKAGPGILKRIMVNGGTLDAVVVYDNTVAAGTIIATFTPAAAGEVYEYGVYCANGISLNLADATNLTVVYK